MTKVVNQQERMAKTLSEAQLQDAVMELARLLGWLAFHLHDSRQAGEPGIPDLLLARDGHTLLVELKSEDGKVSTKRGMTKAGRVLPSQADWIEASGALVWRPSDLLSGEIERTLRPTCPVKESDAK